MKTLIGLLASVIFLFGGSAPIPGSETKVNFVVPKGQSAGQIIQSLSSQNLIKSQFTTKIYLKLTGLDQKIIPGSYVLSPGQNLSEVVTVLTSGPKDIWVTFPEGWRREQIATRLAATVKDFDSQEFITKTASQEGSLFPDTYLISPQAGVDDVIKILTSNFSSKSQLDLSRAEDQQTLIIASLIERESRSDQERPIISGIIHNRLNSLWPLQIDASIQYVQGNFKDWWPKEINTKIMSAYNTYTHAGLPPAPICNPGLSSIQAARNPQKTPYFFYLHDSSGQVHYARTLSEHNLNIDKYLRP